MGQIPGFMEYPDQFGENGYGDISGSRSAEGQADGHEKVGAEGAARLLEIPVHRPCLGTGADDPDILHAGKEFRTHGLQDGFVPLVAVGEDHHVGTLLEMVDGILVRAEGQGRRL